MVPEPTGVESARALLLGREVAAVCFVRDYVELHLDGPVLRAISDPHGTLAGRQWRFPEGDAAAVMLGLIGAVVDAFTVVEQHQLTLGLGADRFVVPLDDASRCGTEAVHVIGVDRAGRTDGSQL